jgi:ABC-type nitrate/sulfonate/bicarbonate transport system ATPase subunit
MKTEILSTGAEILSMRTEILSNKTDILFSCENITKTYEGNEVVADISLELKAGRFISLVGPSGVGKTTLFNVLAGVDKPDEGRVFLLGEDITGVSGRVSYMLQKDLLLDYRTVLDNVILPLLIRGQKKKEAREYAASFFPHFGLEGYEKRYPRQLSGGMRQRAALLRTCMLRNPVILLDEPFSSLDAITRRQMQAWYQDIAREMSLSTIFITHDVEEALTLSDSVAILTGKPGRISCRLEVLPPRPRSHGFPVSQEFSAQKQLIMEAIGI